MILTFGGGRAEMESKRWGQSERKQSGAGRGRWKEGKKRKKVWGDVNAEDTKWGVNKCNVLRQSILIRTGDQSGGWRRRGRPQRPWPRLHRKQTSRGADRTAVAPQRLLFLCFILIHPLPSPPLSAALHFDDSLLPRLAHFLLPPPFFPPSISLYIFLCTSPSVMSPSSSLTPPSHFHSFPLPPQPNSGSFIGVIRWILPSPCLSFRSICLPPTNSTLLMLLHETLHGL